MSVVDEHAFSEVALPSVGVSRFKESGRVRNWRKVIVRLVKGNGIWQMTAGIDRTIEGVYQWIAKLFPGKVGSDNGCDIRVVGPGKDSRGPGV